MKQWKKISLFLWILFCLPTLAMAQGNVVVDFPEKTRGVEGRLYYLGEWMDEKMVFDKAFQDLEEEGDAFSKEVGEADHEKIFSLIEEKGISPVTFLSSGGESRMTFVPKKRGMYALLFDKKSVDKKIQRWKPTVFLYEGNSMKLEAKGEILPEEDLKTLSLVKLWFGDKKENRPEKLLVDLYHQGEKIGQMVLREEDFWRGIWEGLDPLKSYALVEKVPSGYRSSLSQEKGVYYLKNTWMGAELDGVHIQEDSSQKSKSDAVLPNTGLLWWPVPVFVIGGLILFILSFRGEKDEKK